MKHPTAPPAVLIAVTLVTLAPLCVGEWAAWSVLHDTALSIILAVLCGAVILSALLLLYRQRDRACWTPPTLHVTLPESAQHGAARIYDSIRNRTPRQRKGISTWAPAETVVAGAMDRACDALDGAGRDTDETAGRIVELASLCPGIEYVYIAVLTADLIPPRDWETLTGWWRRAGFLPAVPPGLATAFNTAPYRGQQ